MPALRPSEIFQAEALRILAAQQNRLTDLGVRGELVLVGGCSVPRALTKGDVDLHLRVAPDDFGDAVEVLSRSLAVVHPEIWGPTLATFEVPAALPTGLAVTPIDSEHDARFTRCWQLLAADQALVAEYNAMKQAGDGAADAAYETRKSAFFDRLVHLWPGHPAGGGRETDSSRPGGRPGGG